MSERGFVEEEVRKMSKTTDKDDGAGRFLKGLFEDRLTATMKIRSCLERIVEDQRNEELVYKEYIQKSLKRPIGGTQSSIMNTGEIALIDRRISVLDEKYHQEFEKRVKLQKAFVNFKTEGNSIIDRLRFALRQVGSKYKKERLKNRHLTKRLNEQLLNQNEIGEEEKFRKLKQLLQATSNELQKYKVQFNRVEDKFVSYKKMVVDHKKVIAALRKKLERFQEENEHLRKQASTVSAYTGPNSPHVSDRPTQEELSPMVRAQGGESQESESSEEDEDSEEEEIDEIDDDDEEEDEVEMKSRLGKYGVEDSEEEYDDDDDDDDSERGKKKSAKAVVKDQQVLIKKLLDQLETEEDQRLKTEEQSFQMVEEEERTISFLESQIKNLTNNSLLRDEEEEDGGGLEGMSPIKDME